MNSPRAAPRWMRAADWLMAAALAVMVVLVFANVVLRYGFGTGIASAEELSRLLFVWMVFIGATAAYPRGEQMAFLGLLARFKGLKLRIATQLIHGCVLLACVLVAWGAWQQVVIGLDSKSVVLGYPMALLPLPAFLSAVIIAIAAVIDIVRGRPLIVGHEIPEGDYE